MTTPKLHQSADLLCPFLMITSGAMYSIVPQNVLVVPEVKLDPGDRFTTTFSKNGLFA